MLLRGNNIEANRAINLVMLESVARIRDVIERVHGVLNVPDPNAALVGADRFGERLRSLLAAAREPQTVQADAMGIGTSTLTLWLSGERYPSYWNLVRVAEYFHVTPNWLMTGQA